MPSKLKQQSMTDVLRHAIEDSGLAFIELERQTGVLRQSLMKFARGETSLRLDLADKLAEFFDLQLQPRKAAKPKRKAK
jgi:transcriptional regulator with XRE-family HTH domain